MCQVSGARETQVLGSWVHSPDGTGVKLTDTLPKATLWLKVKSGSQMFGSDWGGIIIILGVPYPFLGSFSEFVSRAKQFSDKEWAKRMGNQTLECPFSESEAQRIKRSCPQAAVTFRLG